MKGMNPSNEAGGALEPFPAVPPMPPPPGTVPSSGQDAAANAVPPLTMPLPPDPGRNPAVPASQIDVQATTRSATPTVVDDGDLIEKEWVSKAKQIVEKNRNDPYKQSEELTAFRADYMKKRYNKNIKLDK